MPDDHDRCPVCEGTVQLDGRTTGTFMECPHCRAGFLVQIESNEAGGWRTSVLVGQPSGGLGPRAAALFEVKGELGRGGQGSVWRVRPRGAARDFALKYATVTRRVALASRTRELDLSGRLTHPNVVAVHALGEDEDPRTGAACRYFVYEIVEGRTLGSVIAGGAMDLPAAVSVGFEILAGLAHCHDRGVVHLDLKPDNILITAGGSAKILDFGIARSVGTHDRLGAEGTEDFSGTPAYAAPERVLGQGALRASDVYGFGVMFYEMLTGRRPFTGPSVEALLHHQVHTEPPDPRRYRPDLPEALRDLVLACLAKAPQARPTDAADVEDRLATWAMEASLPCPLRPVPLPPEVPEVVSRAGLELAGGPVAASLGVVATPLLLAGVMPVLATGMGWAVASLGWLVGAGALVSRVARRLSGNPWVWLEESFFAEAVSAGLVKFLALVTQFLSVIFLWFSLGSGATQAGISSTAGGLGWPIPTLWAMAVGLMQSASSWLLFGPVLLRWIDEGLESRVTERVRKGQLLLEVRGPAGLTAALGDAPMTPLPTRLQLVAGRYTLVVSDRLVRRSFTLQSTGAARQAVTFETGPRGPQPTASVDPDGTDSGLAALWGSLAGSVPATLMTGVILVAVGGQVTGGALRALIPPALIAPVTVPLVQVAVAVRRPSPPPRPRPTATPTPRSTRLGLDLVAGSRGRSLRDPFFGWSATLDAQGDPLPAGARCRAGSLRLRHPASSWAGLAANGTVLVSVGRDQRLRKWDPVTGRCLAVADAGQPLVAGAVSADGSTVAAGTEKGEVLLWDLRTGRPTFTIAVGSMGAILVLALSDHADRLLATCVGDDAVHRIGEWSLPSGNAVRDVHTTEWKRRVDYVPGSLDTVETLEAGSLFVRTRASPGLTLPCSPTAPFSVTPDGSMVLTLDRSDDLAWWDLKSGKLVRTARRSGRPGSAGLNGFPSSPEHGLADLAALAPTHGALMLFHDRLVHVAPDGREVRRRDLRRATLFVRRLTVSRNEGRVLIHEPGAVLDVRTPPDLLPVPTGTGHSQPVCALAFAPDGASLISVSGEGRVLAWDPTTAHFLGSRSPEPTATSAVTIEESVAVQADGTVVTASRDSSLQLTIASRRSIEPTSTGTPMRMARSGQLSGGRLSPNGRWAVMSADRGVLHLVSTADRREVRLGAPGPVEPQGAPHGAVPAPPPFPPEWSTPVTADRPGPPPFLPPLPGVRHEPPAPSGIPGARGAGSGGSAPGFKMAEGSGGPDSTPRKAGRTPAGPDEPAMPVRPVHPLPPPMFPPPMFPPLPSLQRSHLAAWASDSGTLVIARTLLPRAVGPYTVPSSGDTTSVVDVWAVDAGLSKGTIGRWQQGIEALAVDGPRGHLAVADRHGKQLALHDLAGGRLRQMIGGFATDPATSIAFDRTGTRLAVGTAQGRVRVFALPGAALLREFTGHQARVRCLAFSPDGRSLASGSTDTTILVWNLDR